MPFPEGLVWVGTGRRKGVETKPCWIRDGHGRDRVAGWATARVAPTRASSPSCWRVGATLVVAHAIRFPDVGGTPRATRRRKRSRAGFEMGDRAPCGRDRVAGWATARVAPTRASSPSCWRVGATLVVAHAIAPAGCEGLVWVGTGRQRAWHATAYEGNEAVRIRDGDRAPSGRDRVAGWATARVAPTRASSPSCWRVGATLVVAHAIAPAGCALSQIPMPSGCLSPVGLRCASLASRPPPGRPPTQVPTAGSWDSVSVSAPRPAAATPRAVHASRRGVAVGPMPGWLFRSRLPEG